MLSAPFQFLPCFDTEWGGGESYLSTDLFRMRGGGILRWGGAHVLLSLKLHRKNGLGRNLGKQRWYRYGGVPDPWGSHVPSYMHGRKETLTALGFWEGQIRHPWCPEKDPGNPVPELLPFPWLPRHSSSEGRNWTSSLSQHSVVTLNLPTQLAWAPSPSPLQSLGGAPKCLCQKEVG